MPQVMHFKVVASVEFEVDGPYTYAEAVKLAEERLDRLATPADKALNGIQHVNVARLAVDRSR